MGGWKRSAPEMRGALKTGYELDAVVREALEEDGDVFGYHFSDCELKNVSGRTLEFSECIFERCAFGELDIGRISFVDCRFEKCEMSNVRLNNATFQRAAFKACRMTGMECLRGLLMNTAFDGCMMDYMSLSETRLDRVEFVDCRMRESLWADVKLPKVRLDRTDLTRAQWMRTPLAGMDISTCLIGGWNISLLDLRGARVTAAQMIELSGLLGVEIVS